jgi:tRNA threonylcarbamoyladenosine biosynthesis protein TsaB
MKTVLALEASSDTASVALWRDGEMIAGREFYSKQSLSSDLFPVLSCLLEGVSSVDTIVVGLGPGSYAGVRITIAAALGLQCVWGCKVVGVPSVAAAGNVTETFQVIGDARRGSWYYAQIIEGLCVVGPLLLESTEHLRVALAKGHGPVRASEILAEDWKAELAVPRAENLARLAAAGKGVVETNELEPLYLRAPHITAPRPR